MWDWRSTDRFLFPEVKGQRLKDVPSFKRVAGGAPANVVGAVTKLGIPSNF